jgi:carboxylesterase
MNMEQPVKPYTLTPITHPDAQPFRWEGRAPACLLAHGLTSTPWEVRPVGLALREAGFHTESLWLPGHGTRPEDLGKVRWRDWTSAVEERFDQMQRDHERVAVLGTSLGGALALWLAAERPVVAVVTMGAPVWLDSRARWARLLSYIRPFQTKRPKGSAIFDDEARLLHPSYPKSSLRAVAEMWDFMKALRPHIHRITAPLLVCHARRDSVVAPASAEWIYSQARSETKKLLWLENSDHIITEDFDHPIVTRAAVEWIRQVASPEE